MATFKVFATTDYVSFDCTSEFDTREEAQAFADQFPKSNKFYVSRLSTYRGTPGQDDYEPYATFTVTTNATKLAADDVNKGVNEAGIKRVKSTIRNIKKNGHELVASQGYSNSITLDELESILGVTA